jgi:hypothetical protein
LLAKRAKFERDKERVKGRGGGSFLTYQRWKELRKGVGEKHASFCYFFFFYRKSSREEGQIGDRS